MNTVLIIEDEKAIVDMLTFNLKREGYETLVAHDGESGLALALEGGADLILLDVMLPKLDGFEVLRRLREKDNVPVIMLTAREEERDKVFGLETGADDYITKPFSIKELSARIKANMRRVETLERAEPGGTLTAGPFVIDKSMRQVSKHGRPLELTQREYDIFLYFAGLPARIVTREELMEKVWGYGYYGDMRVVDVAMRRLREKLEDDPADPKHIMTKRGQGYFLQR